MDCRSLAEQLVDLQTGLHQLPASQQLAILSSGTFFALQYLMNHQMTAHPKELSKGMSVSSARIAALLNQMEKQGLIVRTADPDDHRQTVISLTPEGMERIHQKRAEAVEAVARTLAELGPEDAEAYLRITAKILQNFQSRT